LRRELRYGDRVHKGNVLAVVRSHELVEKEGDLIDSLKRLRSAEKDLSFLQEQLRKGTTTEKSVRERAREVDAQRIAVAKAERTLRSWRLSDEDIQKVVAYAGEGQTGDFEEEHESWARVAIVSPIDGVIVEKNVVAGDQINTAADLFKIADLSQLLVMANVSEEDLPPLRSLPPEKRKWRIELKNGSSRRPIEATFDLPGSIVDPGTHTALIRGMIDNREDTLVAGQFITATIELPADPALVIIPDSALIDERDSARVFVETSRERREFVRRKVAVRRRDRQSVFVVGQPTDDERERGCQGLEVGDRVIISGVAELASELKNAR
jgi:cobalt-zinc-cadmium efflux system membrane fusion protein